MLLPLSALLEQHGVQLSEMNQVEDGRPGFRGPLPNIVGQASAPEAWHTADSDLIGVAQGLELDISDALAGACCSCRFC